MEWDRYTSQLVAQIYIPQWYRGDNLTLQQHITTNILFNATGTICTNRRNKNIYQKQGTAEIIDTTNTVTTDSFFNAKRKIQAN